MNTNPLVSIILPTYNRASYLKKSINSVLSQTYKNFELIIVNDRSADNTAEVVSGLMAQDDRVKLIVNETNTGLVKSLNQGVRAARGEYIARIDDDDLWHNKEKLAKQVQFMESNPACVLVGGGVIRVNEESEEIVRHLLPESDEDIRKVILKDNLFVHTTVMFRKNTWEKTGGYDESLVFSEDWDLWLRMGKIGGMHNLQEYFTTYLQGSQNISNNNVMRNAILNLKLRWKYRNEYHGAYGALVWGAAYFIYTCIPFRSRFVSILKVPRRLLFGNPVYTASHEKKNKS